MHIFHLQYKWLDLDATHLVCVVILPTPLPELITHCCLLSHPGLKQKSWSIRAAVEILPFSMGASVGWPGAYLELRLRKWGWPYKDMCSKHPRSHCVTLGTFSSLISEIQTLWRLPVKDWYGGYIRWHISSAQHSIWHITTRNCLCHPF